MHFLLRLSDLNLAEVFMLRGFISPCAASRVSFFTLTNGVCVIVLQEKLINVLYLDYLLLPLLISIDQFHNMLLIMK